MLKKSLVIALAGILVLTVAIATYAHGGPGGRGGFGPGFGPGGFLHGLGLGRLQERLNLTPDQTKQVRDIMQAERTRMFDQFGAGGDARLALAKEILQNNPNQAQIQRRLAELKAQHEQMLSQIVQTGLKVNQVLTPEQRLEAQKLIDERAQDAAKMRERMRQRISEQPAPDAQPK